MRVSASKTSLLMHCGYFARPEAVWVNTSSPAAERGTRFHKAIADYVSTGQRLSVVAGDIAAEYARAVNWVDSYGRDHLRAEVAFGWDHETDTARELGGSDRDYSGARGQLAGTADLISVNRASRSGAVHDWKTGDGTGATMQLRTLALMLARAHDLDAVTVSALEVSPSGVEAVCLETLDTFDFAVIAGELAEAIAAVPDAEPAPGSHCSELYCPARASCPIGRAAIAELVPVDALVQHTMSTNITGPDHAAWMLDRVRLVEAACAAVKSAIKTACPSEGWTLVDGSVLREGTREVPRFDRAKLTELAKARGATDEDIASCTYVFTESAGLRLSKPKKKGRAA